MSASEKTSTAIAITIIVSFIAWSLAGSPDTTYEFNFFQYHIKIKEIVELGFVLAGCFYLAFVAVYRLSNTKVKALDQGWK